MVSSKIIIIVIAAITTLCFIFISIPSKSYYHSLFISPSLSNSASISRHLYTLTRRPHLAATEANAEAALYVLSTLSNNQIKSHLAEYAVLLTYPDSQSMTLIRPSPEPSTTFSLRQEVYEGDPYADMADQVVPTFHAYAMSGTAKGPVAYVNYGRVEDYTTLKEIGINVSGAIMLARYGEIFRGDIVENAYNAGAIGVLVYTDRKDYGGAGRDTKWFPDDRWMPPSGVQVGTVYNGAGDPTTRGWPSTIEGCERLSRDEVEKRGDVPLIPSLPISGADGEEILRSIGGVVANDTWQGDKDAPVYRVGPGPGIIDLSYKAREVISKIQNVIGILEGEEEPERFVILGNHRDAWTFGAVDPSSGTAALLEVAERLGKLQKEGWKPRRSIIFCNWDAEEYGLVGSTEWVEENREMLALKVVAYLNVDYAVDGPGFKAYATPQLDQLIIEATKRVQDPDNYSQTVYESWVQNTTYPDVRRLGDGQSDDAAFLQHVGIPAADISFANGTHYVSYGLLGCLLAGYPVYHSMYDDFVWMSNFGDPMFRRHVAAASIWGLVALRLADEQGRIYIEPYGLLIGNPVKKIPGSVTADEEILPLNYESYVYELQKSAEDLESKLSNKSISLIPLFKSVEKMKRAAKQINDEIKDIKDKKSWVFMWKKKPWKLREINDRLMMAERALTDREGLVGRPWYKHLIYAPSKHNNYGSKCFPGIDDAVQNAESLNTEDSWNSVQHEIWRVSRAVTQASLVLCDELR